LSRDKTLRFLWILDMGDLKNWQFPILPWFVLLLWLHRIQKSIGLLLKNLKLTWDWVLVLEICSVTI